MHLNIINIFNSLVNVNAIGELQESENLACITVTAHLHNSIFRNKHIIRLKYLDYRCKISPYNIFIVYII